MFIGGIVVKVSKMWRRRHCMTRSGLAVGLLFFSWESCASLHCSVCGAIKRVVKREIEPY